jgi:hypothetical protein
MTVGELIEELKKWPEDMPVAVFDTIIYPPEHNYNKLTLVKKTWVDSNYPFDQPDFDYINIE